MAGERARERPGRAWVHGEVGNLRGGTEEPSQNWELVLCARQGGAHVQQTSAEALLLSPVLSGPASGIIIFSQVPRESSYPATGALIPL